MAKKIRLKVASPCDANWETMTGDEAKRFCSLCKKDVYELSNMSLEEVEMLLAAQSTMGICGRFYQRSDGTLITSDCSIGKAKKRKKQRVTIMAGATAALAIYGGHNLYAGDSVSNKGEIAPIEDVEPVYRQMEDFGEMTMGDVAIEEKAIKGEVMMKPPIKKIMGKIARPKKEANPHRLMGVIQAPPRKKSRKKTRE